MKGLISLTMSKVCLLTYLLTKQVKACLNSTQTIRMEEAQGTQLNKMEEAQGTQSIRMEEAQGT